MAGSHSTKRLSPEKPYPDFPLGWHSSGYWCKRIRGKLYYFGPRWGNWKPALEQYQQQRDDLYAGRKPRPAAEETQTVRFVCNHFLTVKKRQLDSDELAECSFRDYLDTCERVVNEFGPNRCVEDLTADDFDAMRAKLAKRWAPTTLSNEIQRIRVLFNHAWDHDLIARPVKLVRFKRPSKKRLRQHRQSKGKRMFEPLQLNDLLDVAKPQIRAMILLAINCGFGNRDCATLRPEHVDLATGWVDFPRSKTAVDRRSKLWPETITALQHVLDKRSNSDLAYIFVTKYGRPWYTAKGNDCPISKEFRKLLDELGIYRPGLSFYTIRHVYRTIADGIKDAPAIDFTMGHERDDMASRYREEIADDRLEAVAAFVRGWLFGGRGDE